MTTTTALQAAREAKRLAEEFAEERENLAADPGEFRVSHAFEAEQRLHAAIDRLAALAHQEQRAEPLTRQEASARWGELMAEARRLAPLIGMQEITGNDASDEAEDVSKEEHRPLGQYHVLQGIISTRAESLTPGAAFRAGVEFAESAHGIKKD